MNRVHLKWYIMYVVICFYCRKEPVFKNYIPEDEKLQENVEPNAELAEGWFCCSIYNKHACRWIYKSQMLIFKQFGNTVLFQGGCKQSVLLIKLSSKSVCWS